VKDNGKGVRYVFVFILVVGGLDIKKQCHYCFVSLVSGILHVKSHWVAEEPSQVQCFLTNVTFIM
jgi:hypothetical protein